MKIGLVCSWSLPLVHHSSYVLTSHNSTVCIFFSSSIVYWSGTLQVVQSTQRTSTIFKHECCYLTKLNIHIQFWCSVWRLWGFISSVPYSRVLTNPAGVPLWRHWFIKYNVNFLMHWRTWTGFLITLPHQTCWLIGITAKAACKKASIWQVRRHGKLSLHSWQILLTFLQTSHCCWASSHWSVYVARHLKRTTIIWVPTSMGHYSTWKT